MIGSVHSLRRTCVGYQSGAHCPNEECALCLVLNYHRDLETLRAQAEQMTSSAGKLDFLSREFSHKESLSV